MFVIVGTWRRPPGDEAEGARSSSPAGRLPGVGGRMRLLKAHYEFVRKHVDAGRFIVAGRRDPEDGVVLLAWAGDPDELVKLLDEDPLRRSGAIDYHVITFIPALYDRRFHPFVE